MYYISQTHQNRQHIKDKFYGTSYTLKVDGSYLPARFYLLFTCL
nr:MAG TPA: hypothetical protein [Bacteriophage sp.]